MKPHIFGIIIIIFLIHGFGLFLLGQKNHKQQAEIDLIKSSLKKSELKFNLLLDHQGIEFVKENATPEKLVIRKIEQSNIWIVPPGYFTTTNSEAWFIKQ